MEFSDVFGVMAERGPGRECYLAYLDWCKSNKIHFSVDEENYTAAKMFKPEKIEPPPQTKRMSKSKKRRLRRKKSNLL